MATSILDRVAAAPTPTPAHSGPLPATLLDADGVALCHIDVLAPLDQRTIDIADVTAPDRLLGFYFGRAERRVTLRLIDGLIEGRLETRWETTGRRWWLEPG